MHANGAADALERLDLLAQEAGVPSQARRIAPTVHLVAHLERLGSHRRVAELVRVRGWHPEVGFLVDAIGLSPTTQGEIQ